MKLTVMSIKIDHHLLDIWNYFIQIYISQNINCRHLVWQKFKNICPSFTLLVDYNYYFSNKVLKFQNENMKYKMQHLQIQSDNSY